MKLLRFGSGLLIILLLLVSSGCGSDPTLGILMPMSGSATTYGVSMRMAVNLALEHAKENPDYPEGLIVVEADSATDPETAASEFRKLVKEHGANMVIAGITSDEAKEVLPVLERLRVVCLSPSATAPFLTKKSQYFFRVFPSDDLEGRRAGRFLSEDRQHSSTVIYSTPSEHARGIEPPFRQMFEQTLNGKVTGRIHITDENWIEDSTDILTAHNPESAYILGLAEDLMTVLRHLKEKGFKGTICASSASCSGEALEQNAELVEGIFFPQPSFDVNEERPVAQAFVKAFRDKYSRDPDIYAAHAYDAVLVGVAALAKAKRLETPSIMKALKWETREFPGVTGIIQFDDFGDVNHNPVMFIVKDGQVLNHQRYVEEQKKLIQQKIRNLLNG